MSDGSGTVRETIEDGQDIQDAVDLAYRRALADCYPDPADEPPLPGELTITTEIQWGDDDE